MKFILTAIFLSSILIGQCQDYGKQARECQLKYKESEVVAIHVTNSFEFVKDARLAARIVESKSKRLLSLRYNASILQTEVYDNNSIIEKFYAESNMKQRAAEGTQICGKYTTEGYFYDDSKFCTHLLKLKEVGEVWDVTLVKKINDPKYLTSVFFQEKFPVLENKLKFIIPDGIELEIKEFNFRGFTITKQERKEGDNRIIEYTAKELPAMESENFDRGMQYNHPHVLVLVKSATINGKNVVALSSTTDLYTWYRTLTNQLKPNAKIFGPAVDELIRAKKTDEDKIKAIYYWVQDNIRYIAFEDGVAGFKPDEAHLVFEKRYGDCKGMANLTKEMLKYAGYDARLTWVGTKRIMYDHPIASLAINNHMICTVILHGKKFYLDATEKYMPFGDNAERIQNRSVMIEDNDKFILDKIQQTDVTHDLEVRTITAKINGESLTGDYKINLKGEPKKNFLYSYHYTKSEKKAEYLNDYISNGSANIKTTNLIFPDLEERSGALDMACKYTYSGAVNSFNNEYYIDLDPAKTFKNWTLKETRQGDLDFGEKLYKKSIIEMELPSGYSVSSMPADLIISDPDFSFSIGYAVKGDKIIYTKEINIPQGIVKKTSFTEWNNAIKKLNKAYEDQIILKK